MLRLLCIFNIQLYHDLHHLKSSELLKIVSLHTFKEL